jgi:hypothetical protein
MAGRRPLKAGQQPVWGGFAPQPAGIPVPNLKNNVCIQGGLPLPSERPLPLGKRKGDLNPPKRDPMLRGRPIEFRWKRGFVGMNAA